MIEFMVNEKIVSYHFSEISSPFIFWFIHWVVSPSIGEDNYLLLQRVSYDKGRYNFLNNACKIPQSNSDLIGLHYISSAQSVAEYKVI